MPATTSRPPRLQLDAADRGNRPTLAAQVAGGVENGVVPDLYDNRGYLTAGLSLEVPIFTGKRVMGERMEAGAGSVPHRRESAS